MILFFNLSQKAVEATSDDRKITWQTIKNAMSDVIYQLSCMKFQDPATGKEKVEENMKILNDQIRNAFRNLEE